MNRFFLFCCLFFTFAFTSLGQGNFDPQYFVSADRPLQDGNLDMLGEVLDIASDTADNLYILGRFRDEITFTFDDDESLTFTESENDDDRIDLYIAVLDCDGNLSWAGHLPTLDSLFTGQIGVDIDSNLYVYFVTQVIPTDLNPDETVEQWLPETPLPPTVRRNIAKYDSKGNLEFISTFDAEPLPQAIPSDLFPSGAFTVRDNGVSIVAFPMGYGTISFPGYNDFTTSSGSLPTFIIQMSPDGTVTDHMLLHNPIGTSADAIIPTGISVGFGSDIAISGYHKGAVNFAPIDGNSDSLITTSSIDTFDIFAANLDFTDDELLWAWTAPNKSLVPGTFIGQSLKHAGNQSTIYLLQQERSFVLPGFTAPDYAIYQIDRATGEELSRDSLMNHPMDTLGLGIPDSVVYTDIISPSPNSIMISGYTRKNFDLDPDATAEDSINFSEGSEAMFITLLNSELTYVGSIRFRALGKDSISMLNRILASNDNRHVFTSGLYSAMMNFDPIGNNPDYIKNPKSPVDHFFLRYELSPLPLTILANGEPIPPQGVTICPGESVELSVLEELDSYKWSNDEETRSITVSDPDVYTVEGMRECDNFQGSQNVIQPQLEQPQIGNHEICGNEIITLDATSFGAEAYIWDDGSTEPVRLVEEVGTYSVTVSNVCESKSATGTVEFANITVGELVRMPNAFTPNSDDHNDVLKPIVADTEVAEYTFSVYNRWGQKVFETNDKSQGWNGLQDGKKAPQEVYIWIVRAKIEDCNGTLIEWDDKGDATLLR